LQEVFSEKIKIFENFCKTAKNLTAELFRRRISMQFEVFRKAVMAEIKPRISVRYAEEATIATLTDEKVLEENDIRALQESIMSVVEQAERINLILDFQNVRFLSSAVLGLLIRVSKKVYERDGQLRLCNINPKIHEIFKITRLTKVFDIYPDIESATEGLPEAD
jgi:anti-sigma B factor antagonist